MFDYFLKAIMLNMALIIVLATTATDIPYLRTYVAQKQGSIAYRLFLGGLFGIMTCISTYFSFSVDGALINTRVITAGAAGLIGGPVSGITAGIIGGIHRYFYDRESYTTLACVFGTVCFGVLGGIGHRWIWNLKNTKGFLVLFVLFSETLQAALIFALCSPFDKVLLLEQKIFIPKVLINIVGMVLFFANYDRCMKSLMEEAVGYQVQALDTAHQCLSLLNTGLENPLQLKQVVDTIQNHAKNYHIVLTDTERILASTSDKKTSEEIPEETRKCLETRQTIVMQKNSDHLLFRNNRVSIAVLLKMNEDSIGTLVLQSDTADQRAVDSDVKYAEALADFLSMILAMNDTQRQIELRRKAETKAFQAQINPHFFYNALNTISAMCRTKPDQARALLITMSNYYRYSLSLNEDFVPLEREIDNVENYLTVVRARFDDQVHVTLEYPEEYHEFELPPLILQPIVENALRHGKAPDGDRWAYITICRKDDRMLFMVKDHGKGFPDNILEELESPNPGRYSGIFNVARRLRSIYGDEGALHVRSTGEGSEVYFSLPIEKQR